MPSTRTNFFRDLSLMAAAVIAMLTAPVLAGSAVPVPSGFLFLCKSHPGECRGGGASSVAMTPAVWSLLESVNAQVNGAIKPIKREPVDVWSINVKQGDCEEYVLAKRRALIRKGIPASALSIVYALRNGGGHAVLAIHTDEGSYALDNMTARIKPLDRTGYRILSMSGPDPMVWHRG